MRSGECQLADWSIGCSIQDYGPQKHILTTTGQIFIVFSIDRIISQGLLWLLTHQAKILLCGLLIGYNSMLMITLKALFWFPNDHLTFHQVPPLVQNVMKCTHFHFGYSESLSSSKTLKTTCNLFSEQPWLGLNTWIAGSSFLLPSLWCLWPPLFKPNSKWFDQPSMHDSSFYGWPSSTRWVTFLLLLSPGIHDSSTQSSH